MRNTIESLADGLSGSLAAADCERLGALLATDLVEAAKGALKKLEELESDNDDIAWSHEVRTLQQALAAVGEAQ